LLSEGFVVLGFRKHKTAHKKREKTTKTTRQKRRNRTDL
jgi:hypothetical protein